MDDIPRYPSSERADVMGRRLYGYVNEQRGLNEWTQLAMILIRLVPSKWFHVFGLLNGLCAFASAITASLLSSMLVRINAGNYGGAVEMALLMALVTVVRALLVSGSNVVPRCARAQLFGY